jgi:predicted ATPase
MLTTLELLVKKGPTVLAIDDLHWSDPASAEFIIHLFQLADRLPILFICAFRPDRASPAWRVKQAAETDYAHRFIEINLSPLSNEESEHFLECLLSTSNLPQEIRQMILQKAEGNPLFLEEIVRTLIENAVLLRDAENDTWKVKSNIQQITIPDNLQSLLVARIDRLEETAKHVLQLASVIGRSFYRQILAIISDTASELDGELNNLQRLGLILETARDPDIKYIFRQALTHEIAYNTILLKNRREFHKRVGEAVLALFSENIDEFAPVLGHHFFEARDARALQYFKMEGYSAFRLYANQEAIQYFEKAIEVAGWFDAPDLKELEEIYLCLGRACELNGDFTKALTVYKKLERVGKEFDSTAIVLTALTAQTQVHSIPSNEFNIPKGLALLEKSIALAEAENNQAALAKIYWIQTNLIRFHTSLDEAQQVGEKAIALARELGLEEQLAYSLNDTAHAYNMNLQVAKAKEKTIEAVGLWQKLDNQPMLADGLGGLAAIYILSGEFDEGYRYSNEAYAISQKIENTWGKAYSRYAIGLVDYKRGDIGLAIRHIEQSLDDAATANFMAGSILTSSILSAIYTDLVNYTLANDLLDKLLQGQTDYKVFMKTFFLGARTLSLIKQGKVAETEKLIEDEAALLKNMHSFSRSFFQLAKCYLVFVKKDYGTAIRITQEVLSKYRKGGFEFLTSDFLTLLARAQIALTMWEEAKNTLLEARQWAEKLGARFDLWQIGYYLGQCEETLGDPVKAAEFYEMANANLGYVIDHIPTEELSASFKSRPDVTAILQTRPVKVLEQ